VAQAQHWNGASWSNTFPLNPSATENFFSGVSATGASDVWAVGSKGVGSTERPLVEHWGGSGWLTVPTPKPGAYEYLTGVEAISPTNVWVSGYWEPKGGQQQGFMMHWNGTKFMQVPTLSFKKGSSELWGLAAGSSKFVIAVGDRYSNATGDTELIEQWDKAKGRFVTMNPPNYAGNDNVFWDATATSNSDAWVVGRIGFGTDQAVAAHWDGTSWINYSVANPSVISNILVGVSMLPSGDTWAVGGEATSVSETGGVLTESYCP
jgi:hypothetical protein